MSRGPLLGVVSSVLLAVILALMLWFVSTERTRPLETESFFPPDQALPIEFVNVPTGLAAYEPSAREVRAELRGFPEGIDALDPGQDLRAFADLKGTATDAVSATTPVRIECPSCPGKGVRVVGASRDTVTVQLAPAVSETRSIYIEAETAVPAGTLLTRRAASPAQVLLSGAAPIVDRVQRIVARLEGPLADEGAARFEDVGVVAVDATDRTVPDVVVSPGTVDVELAVRRRGTEVSIRPELVGEAADGYYITGVAVDPPAVQLDGAPTDLEAISQAGSLRATVDVSGAASDLVLLVPLADLLPDGVSAIDATDSVTITVTLTPLPGTTTVEVPVQVRGLGAGLTVDALTPERVDVLVSGPMADLADLSAGVVSVYVDAQALGPGRHSLPVRSELPSGFLPRSITPATVEVVIGGTPRPNAQTPQATGGPSR
jgi:YbbR domain-containing protein